MNNELDDELNLDVEEYDYNHNDKFLVKKVYDKVVVSNNNLFIDKHKRYYLENLKERDYTLENTTPYQLLILDSVIEESSWGDLLKEVSNLLLLKYPNKQDKISDFRCKWSKAIIFSKEKKTNFKEMANNLYINVNHTALHSCWLLQDILEYFEIDLERVCFLIHRPCSAEPTNILKDIETTFKDKFRSFIINKTGKDIEYSNTIISCIEKYLNPIQKEISKSYNNLFLFDDYNVLTNYIKKIKGIIATKYNEKLQKSFIVCLNALSSFYKTEKY